ncbi:MAG: hypothetical protein WC603_00835 [Candidatus Paceibacterota bacterium]|jgi:hypothetical protein
MDEYKELLDKIKRGEATEEEKNSLLIALDASLDAMKILLEAVKEKQSKQN